MNLASNKPTKKKWEENKHWKKPATEPKAKTKTKKVTGATKLLSEGDHLIGPATDLLESPENLIAPEDNTLQP